MFTPRNPPRYTTTLYDADILYDASIRYDGIVINYPNWDDRTQPTTTMTRRTKPSVSWTQR